MDNAAITLAVYTGLRPGELCGHSPERMLTSREGPLKRMQGNHQYRHLQTADTGKKRNRIAATPAARSL